MIIRFSNLGRIKETELDLRPLTVIVGPNNSNKTYIAYTVYGLWTRLTKVGNIRLPQFRQNADGSFYMTLDELRRSFNARLSVSIHDFVEDLQTYFQDSSRTLFAKARFNISITPEEFAVVVAAMPGTMRGLIRKTRVSMSMSDGVLTFIPDILQRKLEEDGYRTETERTDEIRFFISYSFELLLRKQFFPKAHLLPAERNAFIITYKVLANNRFKALLDYQRRLFGAREKQDRHFQRLEIEGLADTGGVRYPQPIEDFLQTLTDIELEAARNVAKGSHTTNGNGRKPLRAVRSFAKLADEIEKNIQNGNTIRYRSTILGGQEIMVDVGDGLTIDLYNASSSIKQLAPLLLYLRYRAAKGDLLIIDEPEMNLHPESQARLLEVLAMLVNQGVHVLLTTHSPYLMAHLNNLVQREEKMTPTAKRRQAKSLYLANPDALLQMEQISAYEMRDDKLHSLKDPDYGIRWDTFSDVSTELQQKYFETHV